MTYQKIIEQLLRSRLYRVGVLVELDSGETSRGRVKELLYDGSNSTVVVEESARPGPLRRLPLARIARVQVDDDSDAA